MQEKKEVHAKASEERANAQKLLKAEYFKLKENLAMQDLTAKLHSFIEYHTKVAKDGVAYENGKDAQGNLFQQTVRFTPQQRVSHLDKAAGLEEIADYLDRQLS
jgi:ribosomal protein L29